MARSARKSPAVVPDDELDAFATTIAADGGYARQTREGYEKSYRWWSGYCADLYDPRTAPWPQWEKLAVELREDGRPFAPGFLSRVLNGVEFKVAQENRGRREQALPPLPQPAPRLPQHHGEWKELVRAFNRRAWERQNAGEAETVRHRPLMRDDLRTLLSVPTTALARDMRVLGVGLGNTRCHPPTVAAALLLALDSGATAKTVATATAQDLTFSTDGTRLRFAGRFISCDHTERSPGVPWDCTVCALLELRHSWPTAGPVFGDPRLTENSIAACARRWPGLRLHGRGSGKSLVSVEGLDDYQWAGLRRGVVLVDGYDRHGACQVMQKAWLATAWAIGARMISDFVHLPRSAVEPTAIGDGFLLRLSGTKDDPTGSKLVRRPLLFASDGSMSVARYLAEYLAVRDAACGIEGWLFVTGKGKAFPEGGGPPMAKPGNVVSELFRVLTSAAGSEAHYSSYSVRKGFAAQFKEDGGSLENLQRALRHSRAEITHRHYAPETAQQETVRKLHSRLMERVVS